MFLRILQAITSRARAVLYRYRGCSITGRVWMRKIEIPRMAHRIKIGSGAALDRGVALLVSGEQSAGFTIDIGERVYINRGTFIDASLSIRIGDDAMIGPGCYISDHDHSKDTSGRPAGGPLISKPVVIEERAWIGAHVCILKGVTIGQGAIVGAGSIVTKNVAPGTTVVGNPAKVISPDA